jgi:hypothetical protein
MKLLSHFIVYLIGIFYISGSRGVSHGIAKRSEYFEGESEVIGNVYESWCAV